VQRTKNRVESLALHSEGYTLIANMHKDCFPGRPKCNENMILREREREKENCPSSKTERRKTGEVNLSGKWRMNAVQRVGGLLKLFFCQSVNV